MEQLYIPVQGEATPDPIALGGVEGKDDEQDDGGVQENVHQQGKYPGGNAMLSHSTATPSSPSPKRFIMAIRISTITIITRAMAEPRWGL